MNFVFTNVGVDGGTISCHLTNSLFLSGSSCTRYSGCARFELSSGKQLPLAEDYGEFPQHFNKNTRISS